MFNGQNVEGFEQNFSLLLSTVESDYLINVIDPTAAVLAPWGPSCSSDRTK